MNANFLFIIGSIREYLKRLSIGLLKKYFGCHCERSEAIRFYINQDV